MKYSERFIRAEQAMGACWPWSFEHVRHVLSSPPISPILPILPWVLLVGCFLNHFLQYHQHRQHHLVLLLSPSFRQQWGNPESVMRGKTALGDRLLYKTSLPTGLVLFLTEFQEANPWPEVLDPLFLASRLLGVIPHLR